MGVGRSYCRIWKIRPTEKTVRTTRAWTGLRQKPRTRCQQLPRNTLHTQQINQPSNRHRQHKHRIKPHSRQMPIHQTTWTRKISCYLCCFFGGCHWLPRRMKYQERPYNRTPLHSREAGREQTKTPQHIPFRLFYSQVPFQMHFKVPKKRHTYRSDRFCRINCHALSFLHRGGFVSRRCICSFNGDDARAPWPCNPPRIGRPCRR